MLSVDVLRPLVRAAWGPDTCDPHGLEEWRPDYPARSQCGVTALVVQDILGGDLVLGEVLVGSAKVGNHYWNRLPDGSGDHAAEEHHGPAAEALRELIRSNDWLVRVLETVRDEGTRHPAGMSRQSATRTASFPTVPAAKSANARGTSVRA